MLPTIIGNEQPQTLNYRLGNSYYDLLEELKTLLFNQTKCSRNYDITNQIPLWIIFEKQDLENEGYSGITIFDFIQKYYDWLYCDNPEGANYELSKRFLDIIDIDKTRSIFLERLAQIYASGFDPKALEANGGLVKEENLRKFINGIRRAFYHKKTTEDGIKYFFIKLFGVDEDQISIEVPKKLILRLNGGKFYDEDFKFPGNTGLYEDIGTLSGSYLNFSRLQDSNWIQDWSYLLKVGIVASEYKDTYLNMVHPAGLKVVFEKTLQDYQGPTYDETIPFVCELPLLKNYAPYGISFDYSGRSAGIYIQGWTPRPEGITFVGLTASTGCCGIVYTGGFSAATYLFPSWGEQTNVFNFKDINISTMLELCYPSELGSPNYGNSCT
jgi:hypothetical protein